MVNTILARRVNHIVAKGDSPAWPKGSKSRGFSTKHSWYFRNALVRANYNNLSKGIYATTEYIEAFFRNLILSEHNELKKRTMLVQESSPQEKQSANVTNEIPPKYNICTLDCTLEEMAVLNFLREQPKATQKRLLHT